MSSLEEPRQFVSDAEMRMKKVLAITPTLEHASFHQRIGMFVEPLKSLGYAVETVRYPDFGSRRALIRRFSEFDLVWLRRKTVDAFTARALRKSSVPLVYDFDDAVFVRSRQKSGSWRSGVRERKFRRTVAAARTVFAGSSLLADAARNWNESVHVVPTGVDLARYPQASHEGSGKIRLVWIGSRSTLRFLESKHTLFRRLAERYPDVRLRVICDVFPAWTDVPLEKEVWAPEREGDLLADGDIGVSPLPDTPFTRGKCGFKLIQFMAAGLPVVTTPVGSHREIVEDGISGILVADDEAWIDEIGRLIEDPARRGTMGQRGREIACERFDVSVLAQRIAQEFDNLTRSVGSKAGQAVAPIPRSE